MFFFGKQKFFLDLTENQPAEKGAKGGDAKVILAPPTAAPAQGKPETAPAKAAAVAAPVAPVAVAPATLSVAAPVASAPVAPAPVAPAPAAAPSAAAPAAPARTTAEEIAAQLAAEAANRPAPTLTTFAPECVVPGGATPRRRRKAGANLGAFKAMAKGMLKS